MSALSINTRRVIAERRHGAEHADVKTLAAVFGVSTQRIAAAAYERCAACGEAICGHSDSAWSGSVA